MEKTNYLFCGGATIIQYDMDGNQSMDSHAIGNGDGYDQVCNPSAGDKMGGGMAHTATTNRTGCAISTSGGQDTATGVSDRAAPGSGDSADRAADAGKDTGRGGGVRAAKESLLAYRYIKQEIALIHEQINDLTHVNADKALIEQMRRRNRELSRTCQELDQSIGELPPRERAVLRYRYIHCLPWAEILEKIGYEWAQTYRLHRRALELLGRRLPPGGLDAKVETK